MKKPPPTVAELKDAVQHGFLVESEIRQKGHHVFGVCLPDDTVVVNPMPSYVEFALHELVHRLRPRMSDKRVWKEAARLLAEMSDDEVKWFYRTYRRRALKRRKPIILKPTDGEAA